MATQTDPFGGGGGGGGSDPIGSQFDVINKMISGGGKSMGAPPDGSTGPAAGTGLNIGTSDPTIKAESVSGNSLDQITRSINNLLAGQGQQTFQAGSGILGQGGQQFGGGMQTFKPSLDYWNSILSGDPTKVQQYIAPMAQQISDAYAGAKTSADTQLPVGGGRSATMANLPFQQAGEVAKLYQGMQPTAANAIDNIASQMSSLALGQEGVGMQEQGQGLQQIMTALQSLFQRRGQNITETGNVMNMVGQIAQAAGGAAGGFAKP